MSAVTREQLAEMFGVHRWKSMGLSSVECECGAIFTGDWAKEPIPADELFRLHLADEFLALLAEAEA